MRVRGLFLIAFLLLLSAAVFAADAPKAPKQQDDQRFVVHVTPEMIRHSRTNDALYFAGFAWSVVVLIIVLATGLSARLRDVARRIARKRFLTVMLYFVLLSIVTTILEFPLSYYGGFVVPHQYDLTSQSFAGWLGDFAKEAGVGMVLGAFIAALAFIGIRRFRNWWLPLWLGSIPIIITGILLWPVFIDPLFNNFVPLKNQVLKQALLDEAARAKISGGRVYQVDKSKQTKEMNAYVTGLGPSKRIVMWDTLLEKMTQDEILGVMGHEMGHYALNHIWKGTAFGVAVSFVVFFLGQKGYDRGLKRWGRGWRLEEDRADPAALPWLLFIMSLIGFLLSPVTSGYSRHIEHEADKFGLELTHLNEPMAHAFMKFAADSKSDPNPPAFIEFWRYSHPSLGKRIDFVLHYKPWETGGRNELWNGQ